MIDLWKIVDRLEQITDHIDDINNYLDQVHETHLALNEWIQTATESLTELQKQIRFLSNKKTPL